MTAISRGWRHLATGAGVGRVFGFASNLLLSRWLGPTELGLFNLVATTVQTTDTLVRCGGDYALNFELGGHSDATKTELGAELVRGLAQLCSLMTALICLGVAIWIWWGQGLFPAELAGSDRLGLSALLLLMISLEGISASAWEVLLVSHRTAPFALRQGLFFPLRLLLAAVGALFAGVLGAMAGWVFAAFAQTFWLKSLLADAWKPLHILPFFGSSVRRLLRRGLPFYAANLLASMIFYPLLLRVAYGGGLADIGYLRAGQILQQLFAIVPATLVPVLFLKLRGEPTFTDQVLTMEKPLRLIWLLMLQLLLLYCMVDQALILFLFGNSFDSALAPTRLLLITALYECLAQLMVQPILAAGKTRLYAFWQNGAAALSAILGWLWIPSAGLIAYLIARLVYVIVPLIGFAMPAMQQFQEPRKFLSLFFASIGLLLFLLFQAFNNNGVHLIPHLFLISFVIVAFLQRGDLVLLKQGLWRG